MNRVKDIFSSDSIGFTNLRKKIRRRQAKGVRGNQSLGSHEHHSILHASSSSLPLNFFKWCPNVLNLYLPLRFSWFMNMLYNLSENAPIGQNSRISVLIFCCFYV